MKLLLLLLSLLITTGCTTLNSQHPLAEKPLASSKVLHAIGYSHFNDDPALTINQRWLTAQQSAKLAADRDLASQIYQQALPDDATVAAKVVANEAYRVYVDNYLREARAVDYHTLKEVLQVKMELTLTPRFYQCLSGSAAVVNQCLVEDNKMAFSRIGYKPAAESTESLSCAVANCAEQFAVQGFSHQPNVINDTLKAAGLYDYEWMLHTAASLASRVIVLQEAVHGF